MNTKKPRNFDELYPGRFLKAGLFADKKVTLTIIEVDIEELEGDQGKSKKAIVSFAETPFKLVMCKTNGLCIKAMFGSDLDKWIGEKVTFFKSQWNADDCIRVWGSPNIKENMKVEIKLPKKKPFLMEMHRMDTKPAGE